MEATLFVRGERPRPDWIRSRPNAWLAAVATVCFGAFMGQLDASVVALTYHSIGKDFHAGLGAVEWVSLSYLITLGVLLIPAGQLSDRLGRKRVYLWGFALFTAASAACALAQTLPELAALRAVQGAGAALLQANSVALVATSAPRNRLRAALGLQAAAQAIGLAIGPTVGGLVVQTLGWRWVFALNVPIGLVAVLAGRYLLPRTRLAPRQRVGLRDVLRTRQVPRALVGALLAYLLLFGPIVLVPAVLQDHGSSALHAGLIVAALPAGFALGALGSERLLPGRWGPMPRCIVGVILMIVGVRSLLVGGVDTSWSAVGLAVVGLGLGLFTPANNAAIVAAVAPGAEALTGGLVSACRAAGTALGTLLVASLLGSGSGSVPLAVLLGLAVVSLATIPTAQPALGAGDAVSGTDRRR